MSFNATHPYDLGLLPPNFHWRKPDLLELLIKASRELAELKGLSVSLPNPFLLLSPAIIKESWASSKIENINTTIVDVLQNQLFPEIEQRPADKEVLHYRNAIIWGAKNLKESSISTRLILGIQKKLIPDAPEGYRKQQNKIENLSSRETLYTPPPAVQIPRLMSNFENYVNDTSNDIDPLVRCAIAHYQFEAIHPFNDGNGRTGRILMVLQLMEHKLLEQPILFISGYINKNRSEYYRLLQKVTTDGGWEEFIYFMVNGFYSQAKETKELIFKIRSYFFELKQKIKIEHKKIYTADLVERLFAYPIVTPVKLGDELGLHYTTTSRHLKELANAGVLSEGKYGKYHLYINEKLIKIMSKENST